MMTVVEFVVCIERNTCIKKAQNDFIECIKMIHCCCCCCCYNSKQTVLNHIKHRNSHD